VIITSNQGLPDGLFSNQNHLSGEILEGIGMKNVGIFYGCLDYFMVIWCILWQFGKFVVIWYVYPVLVYCTQKKPGNPGGKWEPIIFCFNFLTLSHSGHV
jgi:hypothetical protein